MDERLTPGTPQGAIIQEESTLSDRVSARLRALEGRDGPGQGPGQGPGLDYDAELIELRDELGEAKIEDLPSLVEQMHRVQAVAARRGRGRTLPIDPRSPYFAHLRLEEGQRSRDVLIGKRGFIDRQSHIQIVDWRNAPVSQIYYRYEEGDDYDERFEGHALEGVVRARRNVTIDNARLRRIGCPQGTFVRDVRGEWHVAEGSLEPTLHGGQGKAARAPREPSPRLGVHGGAVPRADKHLPEIAALIDPEQFALITRPDAGLVLIQGGAGSGKTTVALHRIAYLNYQNPSRFRPRKMLMVVPSEALVRYVADVLPSLGVPGVQVVSTRSFLRGLRRKLLPSLGERYNDDTPEVVSRLKKHPVLTQLLEERVKQELEDAGQALARETERLPGGEIARAAWAEGAGRPLVRRLSAVRKRCERDAPDCEPVVHRLLTTARDVVATWSEVLTDERRLNERFAGGGEDGLRPGEIHRAVEHCAVQLEQPEEESFADVDEERRRPVDGGALDDEGESGPRGRLDVEDDALLLWVFQLKFGRLGRKADAAVQYEHVAIDEAQDLSPVDLKVLLACASPERSVTIAGDAAQRLVFDNAFHDFAGLLRDAGCEATGVVPLRLSYRSTAQVMELAREILGPLADESAPIVARQGAPIALHHFPELGEAVAFVADALRSLMGREPTASVALISRHPEQADVWFAALRRSEVPALRRVRRQDFSFAAGIDVTDVAQVKGLEFDYVILLDVSAGNYPSIVESRHLLHIGATRAAHQLWLVAAEQPSSLLPGWLLNEAPPPEPSPEPTP
jgi:DNA helicase-2/ATP-dependent DNA helicase PcrA